MRNLGGILMLRGHGGFKAKRVSEVQGPRGTVVQLTYIFVSTLAFMTLYESVKNLFSPAITLWESHLMTIVATTIVATAAASLVQRKFRHSEDSYRRLVE